MVGRGVVIWAIIISSFIIYANSLFIIFQKNKLGNEINHALFSQNIYVASLISEELVCICSWLCPNLATR